MTQQTLTNKFGCAKWIVDSVIQVGTHTTIQGALNSASAGDTIFIRPGTYTENLTLVAGVNLCAYDCDALTPNVTIVGKCTMTTAGTVSISGVRFQTNSDFFLAVTGSAASIVNLKNCYFNMSNNTGISYTSSSSSSAINIYNCQGTFGTTGITLCVATGAGLVTAEWSDIFYGSATSTDSSFAAGQFIASFCKFNFPLSTSSAGVLVLNHCSVETENQSATCVTTAGTGINAAYFCKFASGSASAISIGTGTTFTSEVCDYASTNTNPITGAGTFNRGMNNFSKSGTVINATTQNYTYSDLGKYKSPGQPLFLAHKSSDTTNATGDGTSVTVVFDTVDVDQASNYNSSTGVFTAPVKGKYMFFANIGCSGIGSQTTVFCQLVGTSRTLRGIFGNPTNLKNASNAFGAVFSGLLDMNAGDTASMTIQYSGSTKTVTVSGNSTETCWFSGMLVS